MSADLSARMTASIEEMTVIESKEDLMVSEKEDLQSLKKKQDMVLDVLALVILKGRKRVPGM